MLMRPLSSIYKMIVQARHKLYSSKIKTEKKLNKPVIVVGNVTAGGTGKTPFVDYILRVLKSKSITAGVISRGYGGTYSGITSVDLSVNSAVDKFGDEPCLLKEKHVDTPIYLSASRFEAGKKLLEENNSVKAIVCDDGFQHFALKRDLNIVLINCSEDIKNYAMLPHGKLREPLQGLARADFVVFTKVNWTDPEQATKCKKLINEYFPLTKSNHAFAEYCSEYPQLERNNVLLVSSIAKPQIFAKNVESSGLYNIKQHLIYKDHHNYGPKDIDNIVQELNYNKCDWVLTTEKDLVKLKQFDKVKSKLKTVNISVKLVSGKESFERELFKVLS